MLRNRVVAFGLLLSVCAGIVPVAAFANENAAKNTAIGATAVSAYLLSKKKSRNAGIVGAAGSVYLWKKYDDSKKARQKRNMAQQARNRRAAYARAHSRSQGRYSAKSKSQARRVVRSR